MKKVLVYGNRKQSDMQYAFTSHPWTTVTVAFLVMGTTLWNNWSFFIFILGFITFSWAVMAGEL